MNERILVRVVTMLAVIAGLCVAGITICSVADKQIPHALTGTLGASLGAMMGLLTPTKPWQ